MLLLCILQKNLVKYVCCVVYVQLIILPAVFPQQSCSSNLMDYMNYVRPFVHYNHESNNKSFNFSLLSYNILAQELLEKNAFLYDWSDVHVLNWDYRRQRLLTEIKQFNADIICFQEVQESHLNWFFKKLSDLGYNGVYKKRTRAHCDGCAIYYRNDKFSLKEKVTVEYNQPGVNVLDRDNVGIVLRLSPRNNEAENIVVSTTHILYNKKRHDIKLAQVHLLLAEIERVSYKGLKKGGDHNIPEYHPIILTGDFNLEPNTAVYDFLINGALFYSNLQKPTLWSQNSQSGRCNMGNELIPKNLGITEYSQHSDILELRKKNNHKRQINDSLYSKLYHSERKNEQLLSSPSSEFKFGTGSVYHNLKFSSVYNNNNSCSTYHDRWTIVDYIFYTNTNLKLKTYMKLPNFAECQPILAMPNRVSPSDHLPLFAKFSYKIK
ncbi:PREDICTED: protein angel homolog 2 isoform X2 [Diuraphis noxia]|uniref:protein angel homolog 2 isoform X2 n=1 Tax=Diuraphis noxia TaxID=143948 RepID=UPI0007639DFB|nr:PREDICTED: protein angel homolog 2 isoform X2 [Diuraphis noxia]